MVIKNATFITSAASKKGFIVPEKPMIAICGKSNVGKSSLINALANKKGLARTSVTPGRTRLVNYFDFGDFVLADLPGYGFAKVSHSEKEKWGQLLEDFFSYQSLITHVFSLVDIRHDPTRDDIDMINYLHHYAVPFTVVATKADKIGKTRIFDRLKSIGNFLAIGKDSIIATSADSGYGKDKLLDKIQAVLDIYHDDFFNENEEETEEQGD